MMKKLACLLLTGLLATLSTGSIWAAATDENPCVLKVGWEEWYPFIYQQGQAFSGSEYTLLSRLAKKTGCQLKFVEVAWDKSLQLLAQAGKLAEVRLLMVPGRSDFLDATGALEEALTTFLLSLGPVPIRLNGFRHHGVRGEALSWPEAGSADLTVLANALKAKGFGSVMLPAI